MADITGLKDAITRVEKHLEFARLVYRSLPFLFWSGFIPLIYIASLFMPGDLSQNALALGIGLGLSIWLVLEERMASRVVERLETVLGISASRPRLYVTLQVASWPLAGAVAYITVSLRLTVFDAWPLVFFGVGMGFIILIDYFVKGFYDKEMLPAFIIPLLSIPGITASGVPGEDYAVMIISSSMALTGFLYARRAFRA